MITTRDFNKDIVPKKLKDMRTPVKDRANLLIDVSVMARQIGHSISKKVARHGINYNLWQVLVTLWSEHAVTPAAVAQHLQVEPATISRYLDQLESLSYITRERSKTDRRVVDVVLTAKGVKVVKVGLNELDELAKNL
jgi:DNA-binding MarR family transcriptional regulator